MLRSWILRSLGAAALLWLVSGVALAQTGSDEPLDGEQMAAAFVAEFNRILREDLEHPALARNPILDEIAQNIARQVGCQDGRVTFDIQEEAAERGFALYPDDNLARTTRIPLLPAVNQRPIEEIAEAYTPAIYGSNIAQQGRFYREIGVGVDPCVARVGQTVGSSQQYGIFVILGAQPNVIPVVIENGETSLPAESTPLEVTLSVHEELSRPRSDIFGATQEIRLSNEPLTDEVEAIPYAPFVAWELPECGENTVYYELTDEAGMTVEGETSVTVECTEG